MPQALTIAGSQHAKDTPSVEAVARAVDVVLQHAGGAKTATAPESHTHRAYRRALADFIRWYGAQSGDGVTPAPFTRSLVYQYRESLVARGISASSVNQRLAPIRRMAAELAMAGAIDEPIAAGVERVEGVKQRGQRLGNWLTQTQVDELINLPNRATRQGLRDRAMLAVFIGGGLRRYELAKLTVEQMQMRDGRWALVDIEGKHHRIRTVPIASWVYLLVKRWLDVASITSGPMFRAINRGDRLIGDAAALSPQATRDIVKRNLRVMGLDTVAPHDLRRTFAKLAHKNGASLEQIQMSLGHSSIEVTARYVGKDQDFTHAPSDAITVHLED